LVFVWDLVLVIWCLSEEEEMKRSEEDREAGSKQEAEENAAENALETQNW